MDVSEFLKRKEELQSILRNEGKRFLQELFKELLLPRVVEGVKWRQFTPWFNDGDACTFSVHDPSYWLAGKDKEEFESTSSSFQETNWRGERNPNYNQQADQLIGKFEENFWSLEDVFENVFGDHVQVTAYLNDKNEVEFEVEEYDHD